MVVDVHVVVLITSANQTAFVIYTIRGPEIEVSISDEGTDPAAENDWSLLPFMALSDGAHTYG